MHTEWNMYNRGLCPSNHITRRLSLMVWLLALTMKMCLVKKGQNGHEINNYRSSYLHRGATYILPSGVVFACRQIICVVGIQNLRIAKSRSWYKLRIKYKLFYNFYSLCLYELWWSVCEWIGVNMAIISFYLHDHTLHHGTVCLCTGTT